MCTNYKSIYNRYSGKKVYVPCGICPSCQQAAANKRSSKIGNELRGKDFITFFVTLNYSSSYLPVCRFDDLELAKMTGKLPVYRHSDIFHQYIPVKKKYKLVRKRLFKPIDVIEFSKHNRKNYCNLEDFENLRSPVKYFDFSHFGICYSKDFTNFIKRLKINLSRYYGITLDKENFSYFRVSEYGPTTLRPHFHTLLSFSRTLVKTHSTSIRRSIMQSWLFCSREQIRNNIEIAYNPARYVSSYVNRGSDFPSFFQCLPLRPKTSTSQFFGFGESSFSFESVKKHVIESNPTYSRNLFSEKCGHFTLNLLYPKYVANRWFPLFSGYGKLSFDSFLYIIQQICLFGRTSYESIVLRIIGENPYLQHDSCFVSVSTFGNKVRKIVEENSLTPFDYAILHQQFWLQRKTFLLKSSFDDVKSYEDNFLHYLNISDVLSGFIDCDLTQDIPLDSNYLLGYNFNPRNISESERLSLLFSKNMKQRKLNEYSLNLSSSLQFVYK